MFGGGFGAANTFGAPASSASFFGAPASGGSLFGVSAAPAPSAPFGSPTAPSGSLFGGGSSFTPASPFGASQPSGLFGGAQQAASPLGASSASLFGGAASQPSLFGSPGAQSQGSLFGAAAASSASLFGSPASGGGLFGQSPQSSAGSIFNSPVAAAAGSLFAAPTSSPGLFAAQSSAGLFNSPASGGLFGNAPAAGGGLFGAPATSGLFGAASSAGGLFGGAVSSASLFGSMPGGGLFSGGQSSAGLFGVGAASSAGLFATNTGGSLFPGASALGAGAGALVPAGTQTFKAPAGAAQMQLLHAAASLQLGKDGKPITNATVYGDLPDEMKQFFKQLQQKFSTMRRDREALDAHMKFGSAAENHEDLQERHRELQEMLNMLRAVLQANCGAADEFHAQVVQVMRGAEDAAWLLRANEAKREISAAQGNSQQQQQLLAANAALLSHQAPQPSPFLLETLEGFAQEFANLRTKALELEALSPLDGPASSGQPTSIDQLPAVMRSLHEYFIHVAARVATVQDATQRMREAYLRGHAAQQDFFDPFIDADRQEQRAEAARRDVEDLRAAGSSSRGGVVAGSRAALLSAGAGPAAAPHSTPALPALPAPGMAGAGSSLFAQQGGDRGGLRVKRR